MKILVAEDEPQLLRVLTVAMQKAGYEVDPVDNGLKLWNMPKKIAMT